METGLTVVIPVYNREKELKRCLDSIAAQTVRPSRVIVVDDGSTDGSAGVAMNHPVGATVVNGSHKSAAAARNVGLDLVTTKWTMFFDSDDEMLPRHIENAMRAATDDVDIVGWDINYIKIGKKGKFEDKDIDWHNIMHGTFSTLRYMARTELFRAAGKWNPEILIWDDIELGARLLALNPRIVKIPTVTVNVNHTLDSITGTEWLSGMGKYEPVLDEMRRTLGPRHADWVDLKQAILAGDLYKEDKKTGLGMYRDIKRRTLAIRLGFLYQRLGGRGTARLLRMFFSR